MKVYELSEQVEVQSEIKFYYYDYEKEERIELAKEKADMCNITFMYVDDGILCVEVDYSES